MAQNPYAAPRVNVERNDGPRRPTRWAGRGREPAARHIRNACFSAVVWAMTVGILSVLAMATTPGHQAEIPRSVFDVLLVLLLAFGIAKRSRVCAVLLLAYYFTVIPVALSLGTPSLIVGPFLAITMYLVGRATVAMSTSRGL
jgi:hypothetical protein